MEEKLCMKSSLCCHSAAHLLHIETLPWCQPQTQGMGTALRTFSSAQMPAGAPHMPCCTTEHSWAQCHWCKQEMAGQVWAAPSAPTALFQKAASSKGMLPILPERLHLTEPSQQLTMSLSIQKHELQFIIKSATAGQWMRGGPKHCLIYFCAAQSLDAERGLWNVSKMIIVFFAKTAKSFLASKKHLGDRNK